MEFEASNLHQKRRKHTTRTPLPSSSVQDSNFESGVLPGELITEILLRLQVKHLLKFKCVSKFWLGLICSPEFVKIHLRRSANDKTCHRLMLTFDSPKKNLKDCFVNSLFYDYVTKTIDVDYLPKIFYESIKFVGSVNGLICVVIEEKDVFLWNPSIRKLKKLPSSGTDSFYMYGFGYDELHDDHKVMVTTRIVDDDNSGYNVGKIYSLNSNSWKHLDDIRSAIQIYKSGMLVNWKLHWAITNKLSINYYDWVILVVDLVDGRWKEIENPRYGEGPFYSIPYLGVLENELSMICQYTMNQVDVWVMNEYGVKESWTKC
ncbi:F-box/kelch-repeat protein At3g23880-like [Solanum stenotomum]|uniref:F-box/kelch-repeat protein At3g23880-like n=1 Tax=Solanum stenotomum TaxID=172797 RepID=UPI0020D10D1E|nr:F-box/kelch-repeat protein At3g23880-like [Solanum stenotomum]